MEDNAKLLFRAPNSPFITSIINYQPKNRRHLITTTHKDTTQQTTYSKNTSSDIPCQTPSKPPIFPPISLFLCFIPIKF